MVPPGLNHNHTNTLFHHYPTIQNIDKQSLGSLSCKGESPLARDLQSPHGPRKSLPSVMIKVDRLEMPTGNGLHSAHVVEERSCVLLVEDDPALRRYLQVVLERAGYDVISAGDGLEAMKCLLASRVDVIVTDALMPNLDGYELCRFVRNSNHLAHLPIILLSALDPRNSTDESEQVNAFLAKPVSPEELLAVCATHLEKK
jgi:CheY-like chemotaxis protein